MNAQQISSILATVMALSFGQVLFKRASGQISFDGEGSILSFILNPTLLLALCVYGIATVAWLYVIKDVQLSTAYPMAALAFIVVPILSHFLLGEPLTLRTAIGAVIIMVGVWVSVQ
jgi:undecaprenyl phosphate-alpha-L-ara4N flippase subunit ArnE